MDFNPNNISKRIVIFIYTLAMFCIYPIVIDDAYYNITITKTNFFMGASKVFLLCFVVAIFIDIFIHESLYIEEKFFIDDKRKFYSKPIFWMEMFVLANVIAWYMADCSQAAKTGEGSRWMGMETYLVIGLVFVCIGRMTDISKISIIAFASVTAYTYIIGIIQHLEIDIQFWATGQKSIFEFMHYRQGLSRDQFDIYMSTFGNINIFSCYIVISLSLFIGIFIFTNLIYMKLIAGTLVVLGGASLMIANSDSGYLGILGAMFLLLLISYKENRFKKYIISLILLACGNLLVVLLNNFAVEKYDKRGGFAQALDRMDLSIMIIIGLIMVYLLVHYLATNHKEIIEKLNKKKVIIAFVSVTAIVGVLAVIIGNAKGMAAFTFNDRWGTYRGFVWSRGWALFQDAPLVNKLFGYGNETFGEYMGSYYYSEMMDIVGKYYDNAHNELLQYLVTLGIFGVVTYLGVFVSSLVYMLKYGKGNYLVYGAMSSMVGYFVQSLVNLNQPITTPLYFVIMALGVGYTTHLRKQDGDYDQVSGK